MARIDPTIFYFFVLAEDDPHQTSPFQGFSPGWFGLKLAMDTLVTLPTDALEPGLEHRLNIARRICGLGPWRWVPINLAAIQRLRIDPEHPFAVVFCGAESVAEVVSCWAVGQPVPPLVVTAQPFENALTFETVDYAVMKEYIRRSLTRVYELSDDIDGSDI